MIILLVLVVGICYAILSSTLSINGITKIEENTWNIYWDNVRYITSSNVTCETPPRINPDSNTSIIYDCEMTELDDYIDILVDAINVGTIDAMTNDGTLRINGEVTEDIPKCQSFEIRNENGTSLEQYQLLPAETQMT